jgi:inorganic pyrophosphatase
MDESLVPGSYIKCRIIGCLGNADEKGEDAKLILVPAKKVCPMTSDIESVHDLSKHLIEKLLISTNTIKILKKNR